MNLAALLQGQNLATLLAALASDGGLAAGRTVEARLLSVAPDGTATAAVGDAKIALVLAGPEARQAAVQPGATLVLRLEAPARPGGSLSATLVEARPPSEAPPSRIPPSGVPPQPPPGPATPATVQPAPSPVPAISAVAGIDPVQSPAVPAALLLPLAAAGLGAPAASLTSRPLGPAPAAVAIQPGTAHQVAAAPRMPGQAPLQPAAPATASPRAVVGPLLGEALAHQDGLAPLFANLRGLRDGAIALALPKSLVVAADRLLAHAVPVERRPVTAAALKQAVRDSGLFTEARAATGAPVQGDLKTSLLALRESLVSVVEAFTPPAAGKPDRPPAGLRPEHRPQPAAPDAPARPPPPRRDGPLATQPVAEPSLHAGDDPLAIATTLLDQTDAALDRLTLSQYASLPPETSRAEHGQRWHAEIPLAFQQGTAVLPLAVEKDPPRHDAPEGTAPLWRIRFALDVEPLGPMQGVVTLRNREVGVTLWAEREETSRLLRGAAPGLETALLEADFDEGRIDIHTGRPQTVQPTAGQFLDRLS
ncbi:MAG: hypothetical protein DI527_01625 [Chelatococcus sp.]|nr:MAG: hypothetical protein DI527_01625 [Chelatococcus sp.]